MGKLHKLRRAIRQDPGKWIGMGAKRVGDGWRSGVCRGWEPTWMASYKGFVLSVLREIWEENSPVTADLAKALMKHGTEITRRIAGEKLKKPLWGSGKIRVTFRNAPE